MKEAKDWKSLASCGGLIAKWMAVPVEGKPEGLNLPWNPEFPENPEP